MMLPAGLNEFGPLTIAAAAAMTFGAAYVRGLTGFGMAIILVPLLGLLIPPQDAVVLGILLQLLIGPVGLRQTLALADKSSAIPIGAIAVLVTPIGMWALAQTPSDTARLLITASAVMAFVAVLLPKKVGAGPASRWSVVVTGAASGLLTGFAAMPGPPVVPFYFRRSVEPRIARASMMTIFFLTAMAGSAAAFWMGIATLRLFLLSVLLFLPMWLGNRMGGKHFGRVPPHIWQAMVAVVLGVAATSAVIRAF
jgi:uncharacterized membrane protein YfcA